MKQSISILGCGWLGMALAKELVTTGYLIKGSSTSINKLPSIQLVGVEPFQVAISTQTVNFGAFLNSETLIIAIPSKNITAFKNLIIQIENSSIQKVIFVSSTSVYPFTNGIVTEKTAVKESPLKRIEELFRSTNKFRTTIVRFGGLFGYDRKPGNFIKPNKIMANPEGFVNLIHRDDCIGIIKQIMNTNTWNETLNACTDSHPTRRAFYTKQAHNLGKTTPNFIENSENSYKVINSDRLKTKLEYCFKYSDLMKY